MQISNSTTLVVTYVCTAVALLLIAARLLWRRGRLPDRAGRVPDYGWMALSVVPLVARLGVLHVVLVDGTNNVDSVQGMLPPEIAARELGSKLVLASRVLYAALCVDPPSPLSPPIPP